MENLNYKRKEKKQIPSFSTENLNNVVYSNMSTKGSCE